MNKLIILIFCLGLYSCASQKLETLDIICPKVLFSQNHSVYLSTEAEKINLNNISYIANINNYTFGYCKKTGTSEKLKISTLFIIQPKQATNSNIDIPYYIALLDEKKQVIDIQYFLFSGDLNKDNEKQLFLETEIIDTQNISIVSKDADKLSISTIIIGFMIDNEKLKILN